VYQSGKEANNNKKRDKNKIIDWISSCLKANHQSIIWSLNASKRYRQYITSTYLVPCV
jgi:hypothetical protein